jgi:transglutaminase-like putative cysteine protease
LQIAAGRLVATQWTEDLQLVQVITLFGTILGLALGKSIFNRFWVVFFIIAYGLILIPWQIGLTFEPGTKWPDRLINIQGRLGFVIQEFLARNSVTDNLLFISLMAVLFWVLAVYIGYILKREGNPWKVIIPVGIVAFIIHSFDPLLVSRSWYLAFYLFFGLLLVARMFYLKNILKWRENHTHTPPDISFDFTRVALILAIILVFLAWNTPVLADSFKPAAEIWRTASRPWLTAKNRFSFMFASLRASVGLVQNFYGNKLNLGLGNPLSDQIVFEVEVPSTPSDEYRFYWEARSYEIYENNQWQTNLNAAYNLIPGSDDINQPGVDARQVITSTIYPYVPISNLYSVPELLWVNRPTQAYMIINPDGIVNFGAMMSKGIIHPGEQYTTRSAIDDLTVTELQAAGIAYPDWVLDGYLQLPNEITPRTRELAEEIASGINNPYDIASAVTYYLRNNIEYTQSISRPPLNQERIDWFLFDYQKGFCNYYATAEVILLRSLGIPSRMAVGFAQGESEMTPILEQEAARTGVNIPYEPIITSSTYVVRHKDAHAWPEVYFPGFGWVIFEPTVSQPPVNRPSDEIIANSNQDQLNRGRDIPEYLQELERLNQQRSSDEEIETTTDENFSTFANIVKLFTLFTGLVILVLVIWQVRRGYKVKPFLERISIEIPEGLEKSLRRAGIRPPIFLVNWIYNMRLPELSRSYLEINRALIRVGIKPAVQDTPTERKDSLIRTIPEASIPAELLLSEYQLSVYSSHKTNPELGRKAGIEIRNLSWRVWFKRFLARFQNPGRNKRRFRI